MSAARKPKAKDPCAQLRRDSRYERLEAENRDKDGIKSALEYMRQRGLFAEFDSMSGINYGPVVEGLPWNPAAPKRIVAFRVTQFVEGRWKDGQSRVRPPGKQHWVQGVWINAHHEEIARVCVPHWDYDGNDSTAREAWERETTETMLDHAARWREQDRDVTWSIGHMAERLDQYEQYAADPDDCCVCDLPSEYAIARQLCEGYRDR